LLLPFSIAGAFMAEIKASLLESSPRPWYRLHLSTWVVLLITTGILVLLIIPGENAERPYHLWYPTSSHYGLRDLILQHGWPWQYLERHIFDPDPFGPYQIDEYDYVPWMKLCCWNISGGDEFIFSPLMLFADIVIATSILVLVMICVEWRRRRIFRIWQFTLRELLIFTVLVAGMVGWWRTNHLRSVKERDFINSVFGQGIFFHFYDYRGPVFLKKLAGTTYLNDFYKVTTFPVYKPKKTLSVNSAPTFASQLPFIENLLAKDSTHEDIEEMSKLQNLRIVILKQAIITDADLAMISKFSALEELELSHARINIRGFSALQSISRLEVLILDGSSIGDECARTIACLDNLQYLSLRGTQFSNASITYLSNLTRLKRLDVQETNITPRGYLRLRRLLPKCDIIYSEYQNLIDTAHDSGLYD
jgi:hypothetical protein